MKKGLVIILSLFIVVAALVQGCKKSSSSPTEPTPIPATDTPTPIVWTTTHLVDNMDYLADGTPGADNANAIPSEEGGPGYWYTYDDLADPNNGDSIVWPMSETAMNKYGYPTPLPTFEMTEPGNGNAGYCARVSGVVTTTFQYGFVGMGVNLLAVNEQDQTKKPVDISGMTGIRFYTKGDGKEYKIKLPSQHPGFVNGVGDNHYGYTFTPASNWTQVDILLSNFTQEAGWGSTVELSDALTMIDAIQFQTVGQPHTSIDLYVDDLEIYK